MPPFPLLRVPLLPLKSIINNMRIAELIRLHLCSQKLRELLRVVNKSVSFHSMSANERKQMNVLETLDLLRLETCNNPLGSSGCFPTDYVSIFIMVGGDGIKIIVGRDDRIRNKYKSCFPLTFYVEHIDNELWGYRVSIDIDDTTVPVVVWDNKTYWNDQSYGLKNMINYSKKIFNVQTIKCFIHGSNHSKFSQNLRALVNGMAEQTITTCTINTDIPNIHDYTLILGNVKPTNCFEHCFEHLYGSKLISNFQHDVQFTSRCLKLVPANWFTFGNLCSADCEEIILMGSELQNFQMYNYVKLWMDGTFPKLKRLEVELQNAVNLAPFLFESQNYVKKSGYTAVRMNNVIKINRHDKTVATIKSKEKRCSWPIKTVTVFEFLILRFPTHLNN